MSSNASNPTVQPVATGGPDSRQQLAERFRSVRSFSTRIAEPLSPEDCAIQTMPDVSPTRWHLAHTTWFFETFLLAEQGNYQRFDDSFAYLFNSYYNSVGEQFPRDQRGQISRPGMNETLDYRNHIDQQVTKLLEEETLTPKQLLVLEVGLQHEQQHQELMLTDIKHVLFSNPLHPVYAGVQQPPSSQSAEESEANKSAAEWIGQSERLMQIGHGGDLFAYDNESPRHNALLHEHEICTRLVTNGQYLEFVESGGYQQPEHWLSLGWGVVREQQWQQPLYWFKRGKQWFEFTLAGLQPLDLTRPICHVSFFEADAFARWSGARLPTEFEWEYHASSRVEGVFADRLMASSQAIHPQAELVAQFSDPVPPKSHQTGSEESQGSSARGWLPLGNVWQWTSSPYIAYPGYRPPDGALGEYNGKFMCNQYVLRGGSCATSSTHIRKTYRNFFPPDARWQFSGFRLAK
jgi:ergothioneine biosynthesis protein EgtB